MGTWNWDDVPSRIVSLNVSPKAACLAAQIASFSIHDNNWKLNVLDKTGLPYLGIVEWNVSAEVISIFKVLWDFGSRKAYVAELSEGTVAPNVREIGLDQETARQIALDDATHLPMALVDEHCLCALVSYPYDDALICLRDDLFTRWLAEEPLDLTLQPFGDPYPIPRSLSEARELARRREDECIALFEKSRRP